MKTNQSANGTVQGTKTKEAVKTQIRTNVDLKEGVNPKEVKNEPAKDEKPAPSAQGATEAKTEVKTADAAQTAHDVAKPAEAERPQLKLEDKLRTVQTLHRISQQRMNLLARIAELETFEVAQATDADELEANPYQGCKLIIRDDKNREFVTNTPNLIRMVTQFIYDACNAKKQELEEKIVFPG